MIKFPRLENFLFINEFEPDSARHLGEEMLASVYLGLEPLSELHGDVHVCQAEGGVVQRVAVHTAADLVPAQCHNTGSFINIAYISDYRIIIDLA